jgi:acetyl-CoA acetyltransferase
MVQFASMAFQAGMADVVACVWADDPLRPGGSAGAAYGRSARAPAGWPGLVAASGILHPNPMYALAARRHMAKYGTRNESLGAL